MVSIKYMFKILDISKLDRKKKYQVKVMYTDYKTQKLKESDWIPIQNEEAFDLFFKNKFTERYYPFECKEILD